MTSKSTALSDISGKNYNAFRINRAYLDIRYKFLDWLSARLTTDVDAAVTPAADANAAFHIYLKYAYLEGKKDFGPVRIEAAAGMIETPIVGLTDKISDYRWIIPELPRPVEEHPERSEPRQLGRPGHQGLHRAVQVRHARRLLHQRRRLQEGREQLVQGGHLPGERYPGQGPLRQRVRQERDHRQVRLHGQEGEAVILRLRHRLFHPPDQGRLQPRVPDHPDGRRGIEIRFRLGPALFRDRQARTLRVPGPEQEIHAL